MAYVRGTIARHGARSETLARLDAERLTRWIAEQATSSDDPEGLLDTFCATLFAAGLPLWRVSVSTPAIDPTARAFSMNWVRDQGISFVRTAHGIENEAAFRRGPVHALIEANQPFGRWRLDTLQSGGGFALLHQTRQDGGTDYVLHMIGFTPGSALRGVACSFVTDAALGFSDNDLARIEDALPIFGLAICKLSLSYTLRETLGTYLGRATASRVLDGQILRGEGRTMSAAILLTDLKAFTALTDRVDPVRIVGWLDEHFDALGDPVAQNGGEILKFLGDGFLAVFPIAELGSRPCAVCERALEAGRAALASNRALNDRRRAAGLPELDADLALHFGEVVYGNVGTSRRLDFTVIGRAVNEASRIEKLCDALDRSLLVSDSFAERCGGDLVSLGTHPLRGLEQPQRIWTVPERMTGAQRLG